MMTKLKQQYEQAGQIFNMEISAYLVVGTTKGRGKDLESETTE